MTDFVCVDGYSIRLDVLPSEPLVVDIGARFGEFTWPFLKRCGGKILCYEPDPIARDRFFRNMRENGFDNKQVQYMDRAVWDIEGCIELNGDGTAGVGASSILSKRTRAPAEKFYRVLAITINNVVSKLEVVDVLKMDVEGAEFRIFDSMTEETCSKVKQITAEIHWDYSNKWNKERLQALMESKGYIWDEVKKSGIHSIVWMGRKDVFSE